MPVLALHGWLDNCATFDTLAPLLKNVDLVALDLAGHARSEFRAGFGPYNIWQDLHDIHAVVDKLGWKKFALLGHSKGAMLSFFFAGTFPDRVTHLACLDALCPLPESAERTPEQLAASVNASAKVFDDRKNTYKSFNDAVLARCDGLFELTEQDSVVLAKRGVVKVEDGFCWRYDPRLLLPSDLKFTKEQTFAFLGRIHKKVLLAVASEGIVTDHDDFLQELMSFNKIQLERFEGGHHFHMSEKTGAVADLINLYFSRP